MGFGELGELKGATRLRGLGFRVLGAGFWVQGFLGVWELGELEGSYLCPGFLKGPFMNGVHNSGYLGYIGG